MRNLTFGLTVVLLAFSMCSCETKVVESEKASTLRLKPEQISEVANYLKENPAPNKPDGWISVIIIKRTESKIGVLFTVITEANKVYTLDSGERIFNPDMDALLYVGDHIILDPSSKYSGGTQLGLDKSKFQIVKKGAFSPPKKTD